VNLDGASGQKYEICAQKRADSMRHPLFRKNVELLAHGDLVNADLLFAKVLGFN
jgi:hypothetical protein